MEADLRTALAAGDLDVAYQPIVRPRDRSVVAVEALLRWIHPSHGPIEPRQIIAIAERSDLVDDIDEWVLRRACRDRQRWLRESPGTELDLAINVSVRHILQPEFAASVAVTLAMFDTPPRALVIEVTENIFIDDHERVREVLDELHRTGVRIALDDYGTGYSSLGYVAHLPIHILKIDRCFISDLGNAAGQIIVASVNQLAHDLGLQVVAEGIETIEQHDAIGALGCDLAQGYLYAWPMDAASVGDLIAAPPAMSTDAPQSACSGNGDPRTIVRGVAPRR